MKTRQDNRRQEDKTFREEGALHMLSKRRVGEIREKRIVHLVRFTVRVRVRVGVGVSVSVSG